MVWWVHLIHYTNIRMSNIRRAVQYRCTSFSNSIRTRHSPLKCSACLFVPHITFAVAFSLIFCAWIYPENRFKKKKSGCDKWPSSLKLPLSGTFTTDSMGQPGTLRSERVLAVKHYCHYSRCNSHARDGWCSRGRKRGTFKKSLQLEERVRRKEW